MGIRTAPEIHAAAEVVGERAQTAARQLGQKAPRDLVHAHDVEGMGTEGSKRSWRPCRKASSEPGGVDHGGRRRRRDLRRGGAEETPSVVGGDRVDEALVHEAREAAHHARDPAALRQRDAVRVDRLRRPACASDRPADLQHVTVMQRDAGRLTLDDEHVEIGEEHVEIDEAHEGRSNVSALSVKRDASSCCSSRSARARKRRPRTALLRPYACVSTTSRETAARRRFA